MLLAYLLEAIPACVVIVKGTGTCGDFDILRQSKSIQQKPSVSFMNVLQCYSLSSVVNLFSFEVKDLAIGEQHISCS